jgi:hypothetical protein
MTCHSKSDKYINLSTICHLDILSPPCQRCIQGDLVVGWGGRLTWGDCQTMEVEEVRDRNFHEQIETSPPKQAYHQHLTFFFRPQLAVDVYKRLRGSDRVDVGHGASGTRCHDGGERQEVSPCLVTYAYCRRGCRQRVVPSRFMLLHFWLRNPPVMVRPPWLN